jgi:type II secretory pathway pseudopilin PulG
MHAGKRSCRRQHGYSLLLLLFAVATLGLALAGAGEVWHTVVQREKETQLLFVGNQFRRAILAYHSASPDSVKQYPETLEDLLEDRRFPTVRRHLRRIHADPFTGTTTWGLVRANGRIIGVYSLSTGAALRTRFDARDAALEGTLQHDEWVFGTPDARVVREAGLAASSLPVPRGGAQRGAP